MFVFCVLLLKLNCFTSKTNTCSSFILYVVKQVSVNRMRTISSSVTLMDLKQQLLVYQYSNILEILLFYIFNIGTMQSRLSRDNYFSFQKFQGAVLKLLKMQGLFVPGVCSSASPVFKMRHKPRPCSVPSILVLVK